VEIISFVITVVVVTASGALAPGPLFFATISHGMKSGAKSGLLFSLAHTVIEFSLIILFAIGLLAVADEPIVKLVTGTLGGLALIGFGVFQIRNTLTFKEEIRKFGEFSYHRLFLIGLVFTGLNPYFVVWWLTVGAQLIIISIEFAALLGVVFMYVCHVWMDYVWLTLVAHFSKKGMSILGMKWYRIFMIIFGVVLVYFGLRFFTQGIEYFKYF
jgi:threonine/homoserine/homoserine lactone efflux protein